jgi:metallo-beta-lactamase family protein
MELHIFGAAQQVTGSMYMLVADSGFTILIDCGLDYEPTSSYLVNHDFPFSPEDIDVVVLTHAHIDHSGNLPTLFRKGYKGSVICTEPTADLADILLMDSANIEMRKAKRSKKKKGHKRLYGFKDVMDVRDALLTLPFHQPFKIHPMVEMKFIPSGHILGAGSVQLDVQEKGEVKRITFTGDLGNTDVPIVVDPEVPETDYLVMEGTYGNRVRNNTKSPEDVLKDQIEETCLKRGGNLIIPAFSVGRTQSILFTLNKLYRSGRVQPVQVFADSPLGLNSGKIHTKHSRFLNQEAQEFLEEHGTLFGFKEAYLVEDEYDQEYMDDFGGSCIIVSSAGMMEGGRIKDHIARNIHDAKSTILVAGYCSPGTLGHDIQTKSVVTVKNAVFNVFSEVTSTNVFSAHPDQSGLVQYAEAAQDKKPIKKLFLTHGEVDALESLKGILQSKISSIEIPKKNQMYTL